MRIQLPEQVWLDLDPASFGSRILAYIIDFSIRWVVVILLFISIFMVAGLGNSLEVIPKQLLLGGNLILLAVGVFCFLLIEFSYPMYFDFVRNGRTPGKKVMGIQVVDGAGLPLTCKSAFLRALFSVIDFPALGIVAIASIALSKRSQRLGDLVANTLVVYDTEKKTGLAATLHTTAQTHEYVLPLPIYNSICKYLERRNELEPPAKLKTLEKIISVLNDKCPQITVPDFSTVHGEPISPNFESPEKWLEKLISQSTPTRVAATQARQDSAIDWSKLAGEFKEAQAAFEKLNNRSSDQTAAELAEIGEKYRGICQRYAYLSTFYPDSPQAKAASSLVRTGRRLIYSNRLNRLTDRQESFFRELQRNFSITRGYILASLLLGLIPALLASMMLQIDPDLIWQLLPEATVNELSDGKLWTEKIRGKSSFIASSIMTNNIKVTFSALALGITAGVGTALVLIFNGVHLGSLLSALTHFNMSFRLLDFIVAHGFLELSVIVVAGGCGLYLGDAIIRPGHTTRLQALQERTRCVYILSVFNALCLMVAGLVEGFISPYPYPFMFKLLIGLIMGTIYWAVLFGRIYPAPGALKA